MKNLAIVLLILALTLSALNHVQTQTRRGLPPQHYMPVQKWEYYKCYDVEELNELGQYGWELVAVIPEEFSTDSRNNSEVTRRLFLLKRPLGMTSQ